jgi:ABC-2 type transport system ATP-binding protein
MAASGRTIVFSSHILEEVERLSDKVLVIVAGRLAASGDFHEIRRLMTDHPHTFALRSSDNRRLAAALLGDACILGVDLADDRLNVRTSDFGVFAATMPRIAREHDVTLFELVPADRSLESVFSYLVSRCSAILFYAEQLLGATHAAQVPFAALPVLVAVIFRVGDPT